mgnify:CR=1 FL=1
MMIVCIDSIKITNIKEKWKRIIEKNQYKKEKTKYGISKHWYIKEKRNK